MTTPRFDAAAVGRYYDRRTPGFLRFGQGGNAGVLHRAVWGPGTATRDEAFYWVEDRIAGMAGALRGSGAPARPLHVVDLGSGVGASLCYLARRLPMRGTGITLSAVQARLAVERVERSGLAGRVRCLEGDYLHLPPELGEADLAYAIEAFVHAPDPDRFFAACHRLVRPGGLLVICDDVLRPSADAAAARAVDRYRRGWRINTLLPEDELRARAAAAGFVHAQTLDVTAVVETGRPRDRAIAALAAALGWWPPAGRRLGHLLGGAALQRCLVRGWLGYLVVSFRRV